MMSRELLQNVLVTLFRQAQIDQSASCVSVGLALGVPLTDVLRALVELEKAGLIDAERVRLTMRGLAVATSLAQPVARASHRAA